MKLVVKGGKSSKIIFTNSGLSDYRPGDTCKDIRGGKSLSQKSCTIQPGSYLLIGGVRIDEFTFTHLEAAKILAIFQRRMRKVSKQYQSSLLENFLVGFHPITPLDALALSSIWEIGRTLTCDSASTFKPDSDYRPW